jgi:enoyl-CoA hydratase
MLNSLGKFTLIETSRPRAGVALVRLNRPEKRNALNAALLAELAEALSKAEQEADVGCVVLTGSDSVFSAGADISEMRAHGFAAIDNAGRTRSWSCIEATRLPIVAAVRGTCFGGGHELALLADVVIASDDARFGQPEIKLGILPGDGATQRLTRQVGKYLAMKMILSGDPITSEEAFHAGLVTEIVPAAQCVERALDLAETIASRSPVALRLAKDAVLASYETFLTEGLRTERRNIAHAFLTEDQKEGMAAFFEKRPARFKGR